MPAQDTLRGATNGLTFLQAYIDRASREVGQEKAMAMEAEVCRSLGRAQGRRIKERVAAEELDLTTVQKLLAYTIDEAFGIHSELVEASPHAMRVRCGRCPVFDSAEALGADAETIEAACRMTSIAYMDAMTRELNPRFRYELRRFRSGADDTCEEVVVMA